ncbi:MAG: type I restriction endonuclease [Bacteroidales bacterium]|nr:type I restriction endonuclease [Bacteroidales bacterium]
MDFKDQIKQLSARIAKVKDSIATEEATKNAFIMPFIQSLGYDVFDPTEVVPEMDCDLVKKKGEKIDYAIRKDGETIMLIECKHWQQDLNLHETQLQKYFVASKAKFGVLTNGIEYRFYSDLVRENIMDTTPFLVVNMEDLRDDQVEELKKFHKSYFDIDTIISTASELKYMSELKSIIREEFANPSDDFVKLLTKRVYDGPATQKVLEQFTPLIKRSLENHINDAIADRLNIAMATTEAKPEQTTITEPVADNQPATADDEHKIITTDEELEGFYIIKAILRNIIPAERIAYRDAQSYFAIMIDDNNRKIICRLYFNTANKRLAIVKADKSEVKYTLTCLDDIYTYADELRAEASRFAEDTNQ